MDRFDSDARHQLQQEVRLPHKSGKKDYPSMSGHPGREQMRRNVSPQGKTMPKPPAKPMPMKPAKRTQKKG